MMRRRSSVRIFGLARKDLLRDQKGSTMIELALVLPLFFMMMLGMFEFSIYGFGYCNGTYAVRSAARYASLHSNGSQTPATTTSITAVATPYFKGSGATTSPLNTPGDFTIVYSGGNVIGATVTVTASYNFCLSVPVYRGPCFPVSTSSTRYITR